MRKCFFKQKSGSMQQEKMNLDSFKVPIDFKLVHFYMSAPDMGTSAVVRIIEQCCFNSFQDLFNGQSVNFILKPPKVK